MIAKYQEGEELEFYRTTNPSHFRYMGTTVLVTEVCHIPIIDFIAYKLDIKDKGSAIYCGKDCLRRKKPPKENPDIEETEKSDKPVDSWEKIREELKNTGILTSKND